MYWVLVTREGEEANCVDLPGWTGEALMHTECYMQRRFVATMTCSSLKEFYTELLGRSCMDSWIHGSGSGEGWDESKLRNCHPH